MSAVDQQTRWSGFSRFDLSDEDEELRHWGVSVCRPLLGFKFTSNKRVKVRTGRLSEAHQLHNKQKPVRRRRSTQPTSLSTTRTSEISTKTSGVFKRDVRGFQVKLWCLTVLPLRVIAVKASWITWSTSWTVRIFVTYAGWHRYNSRGSSDLNLITLNRLIINWNVFSVTVEKQHEHQQLSFKWTSSKLMFYLF